MLDFLREFKHNGEKLLLRWETAGSRQVPARGGRWLGGQAHAAPGCALGTVRLPPLAACR